MSQENQRCAYCNWTNCGLLNIGGPQGNPRWICHNCTKRIVECLEQLHCLERLREGERIGLPISNKGSATKEMIERALSGKAPLRSETAAINAKADARDAKTAYGQLRVALENLECQINIIQNTDDSTDLVSLRARIRRLHELRNMLALDSFEIDVGLTLDKRLP